jgi:epsilon-lactone hydrolase
MQASTGGSTATHTKPWSVTHPVSSKDQAVVSALRAMTAPMKGNLLGPAARQTFDEIMEHVAPPAGVSYEPDTVGGVSGLWARPANARPGWTIVHFHGGWYVWGTARAYRNMVGHIAARTGAAAFIPDYRLAPEHPFPAAVHDAQAVYEGLVTRGMRRIAVVGDSAGGGLSLALLAVLAARKGSDATPVPVGAVVLSPLTDLTLSGRSWESRAAADPYFTRAQGVAMAPIYPGGHDPKDPLVSPLYGNLAGLPPIRVIVGDDEVLLEDSLSYVEKAVAAGVDARVDVWEGVPHVFLSSVGQLEAADQALDAIGTFLATRLTAGAA